jgi:phage tail tape-measure protein
MRRQRLYIPRNPAPPATGNPATPAGPGPDQQAQNWSQALTPWLRRRAIGAAGFALSGVPIALTAMNELNGDPTNPLANVGGAAGSLGLGAAGNFVGGLLGAPFGPLGVFAGRAIGGLAGGALGGSLGEGAVRGVQALTADPVGKEIADNRRRAASALELQNAAAWQQLPVQMAAQRAADDSQARQAALAADIRARDLYAQAMFGAATNPGRSYSDPSHAQLISNILSQGLA